MEIDDKERLTKRKVKNKPFNDNNKRIYNEK
jgi:hypothetical protein